MSASPFGGLWAYPSTLCPGEHEFAFVDESRGRVVQFVIVSAISLRRSQMRVWYRPQSATSIVSRLKREYPWRAWVFVLDGDTLSWTLGETIQTWRRASQEERPDWLDGQLAEAYSKMDAQEETEDPRID
jgi:hypothetical protein